MSTSISCFRLELHCHFLTLESFRGFSGRGGQHHLSPARTDMKISSLGCVPQDWSLSLKGSSLDMQMFLELN